MHTPPALPPPTTTHTGMMSNLKLLDLSYNKIGDKGACSLGGMLISEGSSSSVPLQSLELEANQVGVFVLGGGTRPVPPPKSAALLTHCSFRV